VANDYVTMCLALLLAIQASTSDWNAGLGRGVRTSVVLVGTLTVMMMIPWIPASGLRLGWFVSGGLLSLYAWRGLGRRRMRPVPLTVLGLDAAGGWIALVLGGGSALSIGAGVVAGAILPAALGPSAKSVFERLRPLEVIVLGAVGCQTLLKAISGSAEPKLWPLWILAVPWLIAWDWRSEHASTRE
jgi:hypothetical protein